MKVRSILCLGWALGAALLLHLPLRAPALPVGPPLASIPTTLGPWRANPSPLRTGQIRLERYFTAPGDEWLSRTYQDQSGRSIEVQIFYVPRRGETNRLTQSIVNCIHGRYEQVSDTEVTVGDFTARRVRMYRNRDQSTMLAWFHSPGQRSVSPVAHRAWQMEQEILGNRSDGCIVKLAYFGPPSPDRDRDLARLAPAIASAVETFLAGKHVPL